MFIATNEAEARLLVGFGESLRYLGRILVGSSLNMDL